MEFWGVEVKPGETLKCEPGEDRLLHLSQAALGETKKDKANENVPLFVKFNNAKIVLGTLSGEKCPQIQYDLVFEKELELSHSSKSTSVFFCGYKTPVPSDDIEGYTDTDSEEEDIKLVQGENGKAEVKEAKVNFAKGDEKSAKPKAKVEEAKKADKPKGDEDEDDSDEDDSDEDVSSDDLLMSDSGDDSDEDDKSSDDVEVTPKKAVNGKRGSGSILKTPVPEKKAKIISPAGGQKTGGDGKKSSHTATPHPAKHAGKTPGNDGKSKQQTPKSIGSVVCKSCSKTFNSDNALQAHTKAKHSEAK